MDLQEIHTRHSASEIRRSSVPFSLKSKLPYLIENLKQEKIWLKGEINSVVLLNKHDRQIVLSVIRKDVEISFYNPDGLITLQVIDGQVIIQSGNGTLILRKGRNYTINKDNRITLNSIEETSLLLTLIHRELKLVS